MTAERDFAWCVAECAKNPDLVEQYDRLFGGSMGRIARRSPIEAMVDEASGFERDQLLRFSAFVFECAWSRLPPEAFA